MAYEVNEFYVSDGDIKLYQTLKNKHSVEVWPNWYFKFTFGGKLVRKSSGVTSKSEAISIAKAKYLQHQFHAEFGTPVEEKTFGEYYVEYKKEFIGTLSLNRKRSIESVFDNYLIKYFGDFNLSKITLQKWHRYFDWRKKSFLRRRPSAITLQMDRVSLIQFLKWCHAQKYIDAVPEIKSPDMITKVTVKRNRRPAFSESDLFTLISLASTYVNAAGNKMVRRRRVVNTCLIMFGVQSGLRVGEIRHLKWRHIRFDGGNVMIDLPDFRETVKGDESKYFKTGSRVVVCLPDIVDQITILKKELPGFSEPNDYVFPTEKGKPCYNVNLPFQKYMQYCKIVNVDSNKRYTPYSVRPTYITDRIRSGTPVLAVSENVGTSIANIQNVYSHVKTEETKSELTKNIEVTLAEVVKAYSNQAASDGANEITKKYI